MGTAVLLGYVVTNFGSLVRLRWITVVPLLVLLATAPNSRGARIDR